MVDVSAIKILLPVLVNLREPNASIVNIRDYIKLRTIEIPYTDLSQ